MNQKSGYLAVIGRLIQTHHLPTYSQRLSLCQFLRDYEWAFSYLHNRTDLYFDLLQICFNRIYINCIGNLELSEIRVKFNHHYKTVKVMDINLRQGHTIVV